VPVTVTDRTYNTWANGTNTYASLEAVGQYGVLSGATLQITRTLPSSGTLTTSRARYLSVGGSLGLTGTVPKQATRTLVGTLASAGSLLRGVGRTLSGSLGSSGALALRRSLPRGYAGALAPTGTVAPRQQLLRAWAGSLTPSGLLSSVRLLRRSYAGSLAPSGLVLVGKIFTRSFGGTLHPSGAVAFVRTLRRPLGGVLVPSGAFSYRKLNRVFVSFQGNFRFFGELTVQTRRGYWPPLSPAPAPSAPELVPSARTAAPLLTIVQGAPPPALEPSIKPTAPYATPVKAPTDWPPFNANPR